MTWCRFRTRPVCSSLLKPPTPALITFAALIRNSSETSRREARPTTFAFRAAKENSFYALLKRIPAERRDSARVISVVPGEDLQNVANRTGVSVAQLQAMNSGVDLKSTNKLVVPNSNVRLTLYRRYAGSHRSCRAPA